jgi:hypothetical protein
MQDVTPVQIRFQSNELAAIDSYRRSQLNPPTRPQAIRELLRRALGHGDQVSATAEHAA